MPDNQVKSGDSSPSHPVAFPFRITWEPLYGNFPETSRCKALVKASGSGIWNRPIAKPDTAWSMVIPKMPQMRPKRTRVLEIPAAVAKTEPRESKVVDSRAFFAFFGPAAALAACLALLLIQGLPRRRMIVMEASEVPWPVATSSELERHNLLDVSKAANEPVERAGEITPTRRTVPTPQRRAEPALPIPAHPRVMTGIPIEPPVQAPVRLSEPAVYRPQPNLEPLLAEGFESSRVLKKVKPIYPEAAMAERVQGTVRLKATINKDGTVQEAVPETGPAMLFDAATAAVRRWTFMPARLNGDPVEDVIHVNIAFAIVSPDQQR